MKKLIQFLEISITKISGRFFTKMCYNNYKQKSKEDFNYFCNERRRRILYKALDVAQYIIAYEASQNRTVSNLRLQKLLYFIQCVFFAVKKSPCFSDELEAWAYGPVVPEVYRKYKVFGSTFIPEPTNNEKKFLPQDVSLMKNMLDTCASRTTSTLVEISHNQAPWKNVYIEGMNNTITKESISKYVKGLQHE